MPAPDGGGGINVIERSYDALGRLTGFDVGDAYSVSYTYDSYERFSSVSSSVSSVILSVKTVFF